MTHITRSILWLSFFALILVSWMMMYMMSTSMGLDWIGRPTGMAMNMGMSDMNAGMGMAMMRFGPLFAMWAIMMAAMMLPTLVPTLRAYEDLMVSGQWHADRLAGRDWWLFRDLGWFCGPYRGYSDRAAQDGLGRYAGHGDLALDHRGAVAGRWGLQFSRAKELCHGVCHAPAMYFLGHWKTGFGGGLRMGLGAWVRLRGLLLGLYGAWLCGRNHEPCCGWGLATLFMVLEKLPQSWACCNKTNGGGADLKRSGRGGCRLGQYLSEDKMADETTHRSDADKLPISQRIDQPDAQPGPSHDDTDRLGDQGRIVPQLLVHGVLPLCCVAGRASADRRALPRMDGHRD